MGNASRLFKTMAYCNGFKADRTDLQPLLSPAVTRFSCVTDCDHNQGACECCRIFMVAFEDSLDKRVVICDK